jgi:quercetin dioxygenase-like cupin family protein
MREDAEENVQGAHSSKAPGDFEGGIILDLNDQIDQLFSDTSNKEEAGRKSKMLLKYPEFRVVLVAMRGTRWNDHKTPARISVQVLRGHIQFHVLNETFDLRADQLLALDPGVVHSVTSVADSAFLLTLSDLAAHQ